MVNADDEVSLAYLISPTFQVENTEGRPLTGGYIEVYLHGTRTKYYCYSDWTGSLHPFKIPLDSLGSNVVLASPAHSYDIYIYNKYGTLVMSRYNIFPATGDGNVIKGVVNITSNDGTVEASSQDQTNWNLSIKDTVDRVEANTTEIGQIKEDVANTKSDLTNLKVVVRNHTTEIGQIKEDVANTKSDLTNLTVVVSNHTTEIGQIKEDVNSIKVDVDYLKASPTWVNITSKLGNYDGTQTKVGDQHINIIYSRKLGLIQFAGYVTPTVNGNGVKLFSFNTDIVPFNIGEYYTKSGNVLVYVSLSPYNVTTEFRKPYSITARDVTSNKNIEFQIICPLRISTDEFDAYLASH